MYVANTSVASATCASKSGDWHCPRPRYCLVSRNDLDGPAYLVGLEGLREPHAGVRGDEHFPFAAPAVLDEEQPDGDVVQHGVHLHVHEPVLVALPYDCQMGVYHGLGRVLAPFHEVRPHAVLVHAQRVHGPLAQRPYGLEEAEGVVPAVIEHVLRPQATPPELGEHLHEYPWLLLERLVGALPPAGALGAVLREACLAVLLRQATIFLLSPLAVDAEIHGDRRHAVEVDHKLQLEAEHMDVPAVVVHTADVLHAVVRARLLQHCVVHDEAAGLPVGLDALTGGYAQERLADGIQEAAPVHSAVVQHAVEAVLAARLAAEQTDQAAAAAAEHGLAAQAEQAKDLRKSHLLKWVVLGRGKL